MTTNPIQILRQALTDIMDAEGGEPGESKAQRRAWRAAERALRETADPQTLRDAGIDLIKAANVADPTGHLFVIEAPPAMVDRTTFGTLRAGSDWTDKGTVVLGAGARKEGK